MPHRYWPLFDLEVRTPRITRCYIDDELAVELASLASSGIHDPAFMPFGHPWTDVEPPQLQRNTLQYYWRTRATLAGDEWDLAFAVVVDGTVAGSSSLMAGDFPLTKTFRTGSWLGERFQRRGLGKELRAATLHLGFEGFGAEVAETEAFEDNAASLGVTRSLGYSPNGVRRHRRRDAVGTLLGFRMTVEHWRTIRRDDIELVGVDAVLALLGLHEYVAPAPIGESDV